MIDELLRSLHPVCSGFPVAVLTLLVVNELLVFFKREQSGIRIRFFLVCSLAFGSSCAFLTGYEASSLAGDLSEKVLALLSRHHATGRLLLINAFLISVFFWLSTFARYNQRLFHIAYYLTIFIQIGLTMYVGMLGGSLVFDCGVGVRKTPIN